MTLINITCKPMMFFKYNLLSYFFRALMTHASVPPEERKALNISDNLIRLSVGIESEEDLIADIDQALKASVKK